MQIGCRSENLSRKPLVIEYMFHVITTRILVLFSTLCGLIAIFAFALSEAGPALLCGDVLYTRGFSECKEPYEITLAILKWTSFLLACLSVVLVSFFDTKARKRLIKSALPYGTFLLLVILPLSTREFCLGWRETTS